LRIGTPSPGAKARTPGFLTGRFARGAGATSAPGQPVGKARLARTQQWLLIEWPKADTEPLEKYWLSTLPEDTPL
jgi:hypothetical protein